MQTRQYTSKIFIRQNFDRISNKSQKNTRKINMYDKLSTEDIPSFGNSKSDAIICHKPSVCVCGY